MKDKCSPEWEKMFANEDTHKEFIPETQTAQYQRHKQPKTQMGQTQIQVFLGGRHTHTVIRHLMTFSASLILTQTQRKSNKVLPHVGQNGHLKICPKINARDGVERRELSCTVVGNVQWRSTRENSMEVLNKIEKYLQTQQSYSWVYIQRKPTF